ncbi:unnamed protein product [Linum trigynum]|uniref:Uncharacterized protein n=1 Tax=Linum trigynum TaxID=586398 RepID=A0AAV2FL91_9ROSI
MGRCSTTPHLPLGPERRSGSMRELGPSPLSYCQSRRWRFVKGNFQDLLGPSPLSFSGRKLELEISWAGPASCPPGTLMELELGKDSFGRNKRTWTGINSRILWGQKLESSSANWRLGPGSWKRFEIDRRASLEARTCHKLNTNF